LKSGIDNYKNFLRFLSVSLVIVLGILSTLGSVGNGGDHNGDAPAGALPTKISPFNFTADNSLSAAKAAASAMSFFPSFSTISQEILNTLSVSDPANSPFDLGMCVNSGHSILKWIDGDHSGDVSMGDSATLQFKNCDIDGGGSITEGNVEVGLTNVTSNPLQNSVSLNVSVNLSNIDDPDSTTIVATYKMISNTQNNADFTIDYTANDLSDQKLTVTKNGITQFEFGCFKVTHTFNTASGSGTYILLPSGAINTDNSIMSFADDKQQLSFINDTLELGTQRLLSSASPNCNSIGVPEVGQSDSSYLDIVALGGGDLRLQTFDGNDNEVKATDTKWNALLD
jgi:hypothetical protein